VRDEFSQKTLEVLAKRVGVRCSNPGCRKVTTGPRSDANRGGTPETYAYTQPVRVTLYRRGLPPVSVEHVFKELRNF